VLRIVNVLTEVLNLLDIPQAEYGIAHSFEDARLVAERIGFPVLVRPSYVPRWKSYGNCIR